MNLQERLEADGYTVKFNHWRRMLSAQGYEGYAPLYHPHILRQHKWGIAPCGGITECVITAPSGHQYVGTAQCRHDDNFVKAVGRIKSLGRAYSALVNESA